MRSISLLLCCLALSTAPALTKCSGNVVLQYAKVNRGSSILERLHFHSLVGSTLKSENKTYKPRDTGDVEKELIRIMMEVVSNLPETENSTLVRYINYFFKSLRLHETVLYHLTRYLDEDYDSMMRKIEERADGYRSSLNSSDENPQKQSLQTLANFYGRLSKLKIERKKGHTFQDSLQAVYHLYRGLPTLVELRQLICDKEEVFDFSRETFLRNFRRFLAFLQEVPIDAFIGRSGHRTDTYIFLSYFRGVLDEDILDELYFMYDDEALKNLMQLTVAVILRPKAYFVTVDDFKRFRVEKLFQITEKIMKGLNISEVPVQFNDAAVPHIVSMIKDPDMTHRMCIMSANLMSKAINKTQHYGFHNAAERFCGSQAHLQNIFVYHPRYFRRLIQYLRASGLPEGVASLAYNILLPGRLYPDSYQYPIKFYPGLVDMKDKLLHTLDQVPKSMPKSFVERMRKLIKVTTGSPACDKTQK